MTNITRVIGKLDVKGPNTIKGIQFDGFRKLGLAEQFARLYFHEGIDEIIIQDCVASLYERNSLLEIIKTIAKEIFIPITVAGGIRSLQDIENLLNAGADKVAINTAAITKPSLLKEASNIFGSQNITSSIEAYKVQDGYEVWTHYGRQPSSLKIQDWIQEVQNMGAGEILLTSIKNDGKGVGYDLALLDLANPITHVPLMLCGGANYPKDAAIAAERGADALVVASKFHYYYAIHKSEYLIKTPSCTLRNGQSIDTGNLDFLIKGYGARKDLFVEPTSILEFKNSLKQRNVSVREH